MSRMRLRGLWVVVGLEVVAISGLLVWGLVLRQPAKTPVQANTTGQVTEKPHGIAKIELQKIAAGLQAPTTIVATDDPADKRLFVTEQAGTIRVINADKTVNPTPFLDITSKVQNSGEMGLLGLAFHPRFANNKFLYVDYVDKSRNTIVARYTVAGDSGQADPKSEKVLLKIKQPFANDKGGQLAFGPDGFLYIGTGDGGSSGDPGNRAQDRDELLGKILRIDVDQGDPYGIPASNPFAKEGGRAEIWAMGLHDPWRFSFDRQSGDLFIGDAGQDNYEEIDLQTSDSQGGENYGWRCYEGTHNFKTDGCLNPEVYSSPILEYDHSQGRCGVTGGYVYRGKRFPALAGKYFYADYCGAMYYAQSTGDSTDPWQPHNTTITGLKIKTFGENSTGELYAADYATGTIYQITDTAN